LAAIAEPLLNVRRIMRQQFAVLHKMLLDMVRGDPVCRRLMTAAGCGRWLRWPTVRPSTSRNASFIPGRSVHMSA
jgi:hypothetical protein